MVLRSQDLGGSATGGAEEVLDSSAAWRVVKSVYRFWRVWLPRGRVSLML